MTSTSNLEDVVRHYQRSIERHGEDETRLMHCITKLYNLPIKFEHLQETGIGKTVNALRKFNGEVGVAAKTLVTKWKAMVAAAEEPVETPAASHNSNEEDSNRSHGRQTSDEDQDQENKGSNSSSGEEKISWHKPKDKERITESSAPATNEHKSRSSSSSSRSHSKSKPDSERKHKSSRHDKSKESERHRKEERSSSDRKKNASSSATPQKVTSNDDSSSKHRHHSKETTSSRSDNHKAEHSKARSSTHDKAKEEKSHSEHKHNNKDKSEKPKSSSASKSSKRARSSERHVDESPKPPKVPKTKPEAVSNEDTTDGFDSTMGANFDDVLGMLNMPVSSKKPNSGSKVKSPQKSVTLSTAASSSTSKRREENSSAADGHASRKSTTARKPELLASTAKLEPLDPSIALELPTISNNYKPLPLNQTVMDVVFNHAGGGNSHRSLPRNFNESEALAQGISSKTMRTKIYSGVKTGQIHQVASLFDLCTRVLQRNIDALEYTGGVPFEVLRPVLERATPQQLLNVEEYNPYLMDDSEVLWQLHVQRQCRSQRREEMETWREMYLRCQEEKDRKLTILAESIKASQKISEAPVRKTQLAFVDSMVKPPRSVQRKQEQYGTKGKLIATPAARVAALSSVTPNAAKVGDARLRVLAAARDTAQLAVATSRPKKAPLMQKTLQFMRRKR